MAGHSKWKGIKDKKAVADAKRSKAFTKVIREITSAARIGGGKPEANPRLRLAIIKARDANLPRDALEKAIKRGTGELEGVSYEDMVVEGYGPGGVAILVEGLTDNKNRSSAELRSIFTRMGGNLAGAGSVSWIFQKKGVIAINAIKVSEDRLMEIVLDAGAEDLKVEGSQATIITSPHSLEPVKEALQKAAVVFDSAEISAIPSSTMRVEDPAQVKSLLALLDALDDQEDTQHVYANFDIPDEVLAAHAAA